MLDKRFIRENPAAVKEAVRVKNLSLDVDEILSLDEATRRLTHELDTGQARKKALSKGFAKADPAGREALRAESNELEDQLKGVRAELDEISGRLDDLMLVTPGLPWSGAPIGADESANVTIKTWGEKPQFDFEPLDHVELAERRGWCEFARARRVSGERAYALTGDLLMLSELCIPMPSSCSRGEGSCPSRCRPW